jgi:Outer membrane efflux protein
LLSESEEHVGLTAVDPKRGAFSVPWRPSVTFPSDTSHPATAAENFLEEQQRISHAAARLGKRYVQGTTHQIERASSRASAPADIARLRYREGVVDSLELLDAERTQLQAEDAVAESEEDFYVAIMPLYKALGGVPS